jgi:hypothetical protein
LETQGRIAGNSLHALPARGYVLSFSAPAF